MTSRFRSRFVLLTALIASGAGATMIIHRMGTGGPGLRNGRLIMLLVAMAVSAVVVLVFQRSARRRARLAAIRDLLPHFRQDRRMWAAAGGYDRRRLDPFLLDDSESSDDLSERLPVARAQIHAATRALLVSLEQEMRGEGGRKRRQGRPACRRARLRAAGRPQGKRRRTPLRPAVIPS